jgi:hypothetical protein
MVNGHVGRRMVTNATSKKRIKKVIDPKPKVVKSEANKVMKHSVTGTKGIRLATKLKMEKDHLQ